MSDELEKVVTTEQVGEMPAPVAEEPKGETPEELKARIAKMEAALKDANKEAAQRRKRLEQLEADEAKRKEAEMTETEKATKRAQELEAKLTAYERAERQRKIAEKVGLPAPLASRLMGETEDDMEADAKSLLDSLPKTDKPNPGIQPTNPPTGNKAETWEQKKARLMGEQHNPFAGGGVVWGPKDSGE